MERPATPALRRRVVVFTECDLLAERARAILDAAACETLSARTLAELEIHRLYSAPDVVLVDANLVHVFGTQLATVRRALEHANVPLRLIPRSSAGVTEAPR